MKLNLDYELPKAVSNVLEWMQGKDKFCIYLRGDLGAGKTFFVKNLIEKIYPGEVVQSPTYTLVNLYKDIYHLDLYRIQEEEELEELGIEDMDKLLVEWPKSWKLASNPLELNFSYDGISRELRVIGLV